jgi:hypothetical protein
MPIIGANVEIRNQDGVTIATAVTDGDGKCDIYLNQGTYTVIVTKTGYQTTQYTIVVNDDNTQLDFNLPTFNIGSVTSPLIQLQITEALTGNKVPLLSLSMSESLNCTQGGLMAAKTVLETLTFAINPGVWLILIETVNFILPFNGIVTPNGDQIIVVGGTLPTTATTKQYSLYGYEYQDNAIVNNTGVNYELVNVAHNYTIPAQTQGTRHIFLVVFYGAWECTLGTSGAGTINLASGTYEVRSGGGMPSVTATANGGSHFVNWRLDGVIMSTNTAYACPAQGDATSHTLTANFATP